MPHRVTDTILFVCLISLPLFGMIQACGSDAPPWPDTLGDGGQGGGAEPPPGDNHAPVAVLSVVGPEEGPTPFTAHLDGSASYDPDGDPLEFLWVLSDDVSYIESVIQHEFTSSGRHQARLVVTDPHGLAGEAGPSTLYGWGLANSPWPKFAHDQRNSGVSPNVGPMMDLEHADQGGAFPRRWEGGLTNGAVNAVCIGYEGAVFYTQSSWLRARTSDGLVLWDSEMESQITSWPAIAHDGSIVLATGQGCVHRIAPDGTIQWSTAIGQVVEEPVVLFTAVNIGNNGIIYVGGYVEEYPTYGNMTGGIVALSLDGTVLWYCPTPHFSVKSKPEWLPAPVVPAVCPNQNVVVNGLGGTLFSPTGVQLARLEYYWNLKSGQPHLAPLGPPVVNSDGFVLFSNRFLPLFTPDGCFFTLMFPVDPYYWEVYDPGWTQAPVWTPRTVDLATGYALQPKLSTRLLEGGVTHLILPRCKGFNPYSTCSGIAGTTRDAAGRVYVSSCKLYCASPLRPYSGYPYSCRYSLWSYGSATHMTAPVIGEDGWLYLGYGNDILAIGD